MFNKKNNTTQKVKGIDMVVHACQKPNNLGMIAGTGW